MVNLWSTARRRWFDTEMDAYATLIPRGRLLDHPSLAERGTERGGGWVEAGAGAR